MDLVNAAPDDPPAVHRLAGECENLVQHPVHVYRILQQYFGDGFFLARDGDELLGFTHGFRSQVDPDLFFLWQVAVGPDARRRGVAQKLTRRLMEHAAELGCPRFRATVEPANTASCGLFESLGFEPVRVDDGTMGSRDGVPVAIDYYGSGTDQVVYEADPRMVTQTVGHTG